MGKFALNFSSMQICCLEFCKFVTIFGTKKGEQLEEKSERRNTIGDKLSIKKPINLYNFYRLIGGNVKMKRAPNSVEFHWTVPSNFAIFRKKFWARFAKKGDFVY